MSIFSFSNRRTCICLLVSLAFLQSCCDSVDIKIIEQHIENVITYEKDTSVIMIGVNENYDSNGTMIISKSVKGLGDTIKLKFDLNDTYYHEPKSKAEIDSLLYIRIIHDTLLIQYRRLVDTNRIDGDVQLLAKSCACSVDDPNVEIIGVEVEFDESKTFNIIKGSKQ